MLPNANNAYSSCPQSPLCAAIPTRISVQLRFPKSLPCTRNMPTFRTEVPEAPIHKDGDFLIGEEDVGLTGQVSV